MVVYVGCSEKLLIKDNDAIKFLKLLSMLARLSPYAKIEKKSDGLIIYSLDKLELSAAILKLQGNFCKELELEKVFKVSMIPKILKFASPKVIEITSDHIRISSLYRYTQQEVSIDLVWLDVEYPSLDMSFVTRALSDSHTLHINDQDLARIFNLFMIGDIDEFKLICNSNSIYLQGIGLGITISHRLQTVESQCFNSAIALRIPSIYVRILRYAFDLVENIQIHLKDKMPLVISGMTTLLTFPVTFYLVISSRNDAGDVT
jgi:hypothetical protein